MSYQLVADLIVLAHFLWIVFLLFGAFIGRNYRLVKIAHIAGLCFSLTIQVFGWYCPLTHLEVWFRQRHNPALSYKGSFLVYYAEKIVYLELSPGIIFVLTLILIGISVYIYSGKRNLWTSRNS